MWIKSGRLKLSRVKVILKVKVLVAVMVIVMAIDLLVSTCIVLAYVVRWYRFGIVY